MITGKKVMIVEDEIIIAEGIKNRLTKMGYVVSSIVSSGESTHWLIQTIEGIGDAIIVTDLKGSIKRMNPIAESMTGWKQEEVLRKPLTNIFNIKNEEIFKKIEDPLKNVIIEHIFYNIILTTKKVCDIISSSIKDDMENVLFMVLPSAKDI